MHDRVSRFRWRKLAEPSLLLLSLCSACDPTCTPWTNTFDAPVQRPTVVDAAVSTPAPVPERPLAPTARVETVQVWQDLLAQRPSAVLVHDGRLVVDLGRQAALVHVALATSSPWRLAHAMDGRFVGLLTGPTGSLELPIDGQLSPRLVDAKAAGLALAFEVRALAPKQSVTVLWNERPLANIPLGEAWERHTVSLPPDGTHAGENRLRLHFRRVAQVGDTTASAAVGTVELGTHEQIIAGPPPEDVLAYRVQAKTPTDVAIGLLRGQGIVYYVVPPKRARLALQVAGHGHLEVYVSGDENHRRGEAPHRLHREQLRSTGRALDLDLSAFGERPLRLELRATGSGEKSSAVIRRAQLHARRTIPIDKRPRKVRDIVVMGVEGARADDVFDAKRLPQLPALQRFFDEALVFERAYAVGNAAVPSHAAWLSSVIPPVHLTVRGTFVADGQTLLSELLARAGYFNVLTTGDRYVNVERGLTQGFDALTIVQGDAEARAATKVVEQALASSLGRPSPRFSYVIVDNPQAPYDPPVEIARDIEIPEGAPLPHMTHVWVGRVRLGKQVPQPPELEYVRRLYRGELQQVDQAFAQLLEALEKSMRLDDAIVVWLGLHGEEFYEHGSAGHGRTLFEESLRVPLAVRAPSLLAPGRVHVPVDLLDLAPTLADLTGLQFPDSWQGESLIDVIDDPQPPPRLVVSYMGDGSRAAVMGAYKLLLGSGTVQQFFDLERDPLETVDQVLAGGIAVRVVRTALAWQMAHERKWKRARWGTGANLKPAFALDLGM